MAERLAYLEAVIGADITQFRKSMRDIRNETGFLSETISGLAGMARTATFAFTTPMVALGTYAGQAAMEFDANMRNINAIAGLSADALQNLTDRTLEFGKATREGAIGASAALYTVFSAGITNVDDAFSAMEVSTFTAEAGLADLTTTTEALVATMLSYGDTSEEMAWRTSNAMTRMVALGVGSMENFANAIANVLPSAAALGMSVEELYGNLAFLTQRGLSASRASTAMNAALTALAKPTEAMQVAMRRLGVQGAEELIEKFGGVNGALKALINTTDGTQAQIQAMFNNIRGARAINLFLSDMQGWDAMMAEFSEGLDTATMDAWNAQAESFAYSWDRMTAALQAVGITIGNAILPVLKPLVDLFTDFLLFITDLDEETLNFGVALTAIATILPPIVWGVSSLATVFVGLTSSVGGAALVIAGLVGATQIAFDDVKAAVQENLAPVIATLEEASIAFQNFYNTLFPKATNNEIDWSLFAQEVDPAELVRVPRTTSLWDIFESNKLMERMSWQEFMEKATESGWEGGVVKAGFEINLGESAEITGTSELSTQVRGRITNLARGLEDAFPELPMASRFEIAITKGFDELKRIIPKLVTDLGNWFVTQGINLFDWAAKSIVSFDTSTFLAKFKIAFDSLIRGDIVGAISAFSPEIGTALGGAFSGFNIDTKGLTTSINNFVTVFKNFIVNNAIPAMANALGYMSGRLASLLYGAIKGAISFATILLKGGSGEDALASLASYIGTEVIGEFEGGFTEAIAGSELETDVSTFISDITDLFSGDPTSTNNITQFFQPLQDFFDNFKAGGLDMSGFNDLAAGIQDFITDLATADYTGLQTLLMLVGGMAWFALVEFINLMARLGSVVGTVISSVGDGLKIFLDALSVAATRDLAGGITALGLSLLNFGFALLQLPVALIDEVVGATARLLGIDYTGISQWLDDLRLAINDSFIFGNRINLDEPIIVDVPLETNLDFEYNTAENNAALADAFQGLLAVLDLGGVLYNQEVLLGSDGWETLRITIPDDAAFTFDETDINNALLLGFVESVEAGEFSGTQAESAAQALYNLIAPALNDALGRTPLEISDADVEVDAANIGKAGRFENMDAFVSELVSDMETTLAEELPKQTVTIPPTVMPEVLTAAALTGESGADFVANFIEPIATGMTTNFGEGSPAIAALALFNTEWANIHTAISDPTLLESLTTVETNFGTAIANMVTSAQTNAPLIVAELDKVKQAIADLTDMYLVVTIRGEYQTPEDGRPIASGMSYVPYDGYAASLHKGEMVIPATVAGNIRRGDSGASGTQNNNIYISGVQNADELLRELRRRGIDLERRSGSR